MALVVVSGRPCSGKSRASAELKELFKLKGLKVIVIDEPGLQLTRNESYKGGASPFESRLLMTVASRFMMYDVLSRVSILRRQYE